MSTIVKSAPVAVDVRFKLAKAETVPLTRELAKQHREMKASPTERELDPKRLKELKKRIDDGLFICPSWSIAKYQGEQIRMNGQHSSIVLDESDGAFPVGLSVHIDWYDVLDDIGLATLFRQFDARFSQRSSVDICGAYKGLYADLDAIPARSAKLAVEGIAWFIRSIEGALAPSGDDLGVLFAQPGYHPFITWAASMMNIKTRELQSTQVMSAMYGTYLANRECADEFWSRVASGTWTDDTSPAAMLDSMLVKDREATDAAKKLKPAEKYAISILAWNADRSGSSVKGLKWTKGKAYPEILA